MALSKCIGQEPIPGFSITVSQLSSSRGHWGSPRAVYSYTPLYERSKGSHSYLWQPMGLYNQGL